MRKKLILIAGVVLLFACSKKENVSQQPDLKPTNALKSGAGSIKGVNWACPGDNYSSSTLVLSGLSSSNSYSTNYSAAKTIASQFSSLLGANTIRIPINYATINTSSYWSTYKGVIDGIIAAGMKVIICFWTESSSYGYVTNWTNFESAWKTVLSAYGSNTSCYYEILNEPYSYSTANLISMYGTWLSDFSGSYSSKGRVLCGGTGYCDNVSNIGSSSTLTGCLFSQHIYSYWSTFTTNTAWASNLAGRICSSYYSRTVVTEFGCTMSSGLSFYGTSSTNNEICYLQGITNLCRSNGISCCYWPGLRTGDSYSMTTISGTTLSVVNSTGVSQLKWGYN